MILAGLPVVDTALVLISRGRGGVPLLQGGRDHITHRLLPRLAKPRAVAIALGAVQAGPGVVAVAVVQLGEGEILFAWCLWFAVVVLAVAVLETETWAPARERQERRELRAAPSDAVAGRGRGRGLRDVRLRAQPAARRLLRPGRLGRRSRVVLLAALFGLVLARPVVLRAARRWWRSAGSRRCGSCRSLSIAWAESAERALTEANRWLLYLALFALLVALLRNDRLARILFASLTAAVLGGLPLPRGRHARRRRARRCSTTAAWSSRSAT